MKKLIFAVFIAILVPIVANAASLTGTWTSDSGATYYITQIGSEIFWYGENDPNTPGWSNVAHGKIHSSRLSLSWGDVPKGVANSSGILLLRVKNSTNTLEAITKTGGFLDSTWTRD
jgi:hypothetical protein